MNKFLQFNKPGQYLFFSNIKFGLHAFFAAFILSFLFAGRVEAQKQIVKQVHQPKFTYKLINVAEGTFGYDIYTNGKLTIHQPSIPAVPGNKGFATKEAAQKVVQLVIKKMTKGEMPPTVTIQEMKQLKAL